MIDLPPPLPAFAAMAIRSGRLDRLLNIITISIRFRFRFTSKSNRQWFRLTYGRFTHHNIFLCVCIKRRKKKSKVKKKINLRVACGLGGALLHPAYRNYRWVGFASRVHATAPITPTVGPLSDRHRAQFPPSVKRLLLRYPDPSQFQMTSLSPNDIIFRMPWLLKSRQKFRLWPLFYYYYIIIAASSCFEIESHPLPSIIYTHIRTTIALHMYVHI